MVQFAVLTVVPLSFYPGPPFVGSAALGAPLVRVPYDPDLRAVAGKTLPFALPSPLLLVLLPVPTGQRVLIGRSARQPLRLTDPVAGCWLGLPLLHGLAPQQAAPPAFHASPFVRS